MPYHQRRGWKPAAAPAGCSDGTVAGRDEELPRHVRVPLPVHSGRAARPTPAAGGRGPRRAGTAARRPRSKTRSTSTTARTTRRSRSSRRGSRPGHRGERVPGQVGRGVGQLVGDVGLAEVLPGVVDQPRSPASSRVSAGASSRVSARSVTVSTPSHGKDRRTPISGCRLVTRSTIAIASATTMNATITRKLGPDGAGEVRQLRVEQAADGGDPGRRADPLAGLQHPAGRAAVLRRHLGQGQRLVRRDHDAVADAGDEERRGERPSRRPTRAPPRSAPRPRAGRGSRAPARRRRAGGRTGTRPARRARRQRAADRPRHEASPAISAL